MQHVLVQDAALMVQAACSQKAACSAKPNAVWYPGDCVELAQPIQCIVCCYIEAAATVIGYLLVFCSELRGASTLLPLLHVMITNLCGIVSGTMSGSIS